ncbi:MAG: hypothetical protein ABR925_05420 [Acidimicrobiales bacterium]|jgi:hypothetical protein
MPESCGKNEGAALVAVERANGGELAPLVQVMWTLEAFTLPMAMPTPEAFAASVRVLIELGLVEYVDEQLGLTPKGRKFFRRTGMTHDPRHLTLVTEQLQEFEDIDLSDADLEGGDDPHPAPTAADIRQALEDGEEIEGTPGGVGTPVIGEGVSEGTPAGYAASSWRPLAIPDDPYEGQELEESPAEPAAASVEDYPPHPLLDFLFRRARKDAEVPEGWHTS